MLNYDIDNIGIPSALDVSEGALPPSAQNAFTDGINPAVIGDPQSGSNLANIGLDSPTITVQTTDSIQAAIDKLNQIGGGRISLLAGTYTVKSALTGYSSITIEGISPSSTIIDFASTSANLSFAGTSIYTTGTITVASGVNITGSGTSWLANVSAGQHLFLGTRWYEIAAVTGDTSLILSEAYGDNVTLPATYRIATPIQNVLIRNATFKSSTGSAVTFTDARRLQFDNIQLPLNNKGIVLTNVTEVNCDRFLVVASTSNGMELTNVGLSDFESVNSFGNGGHGVVFNNVKSCSFQPIASNSNTGDGINITTGVDLVLFGSASSNGGQGIECVSGSDSMVFKDMNVSGNTSDGIKLTATTDNCRIYANNIAANGGYGINIAASTCDTNVITSSNLAGNTSGAINDSGTGTLIRGNIGINDNSTSATLSALFYGDGSDGEYTLDGTQAAVGGLFSKSSNTYTLLRDANFSNLTISAGVTLKPAGYLLRAVGVLTNAGTIENNGVAGSDGNGTTNNTPGTGGAGGAAGTGNTLAAGTAGVTGGTGGTSGNVGSAGTNGTSQNPSLGVNGAAGGKGTDAGANSGGAGGSAGTATAENMNFTLTPISNLTANAVNSNVIFFAFSGATSGLTLSPSAGSGAGGGAGGTGGVAGSGGGGSGGSGGIIYIGASTIVNTGTIRANGGNGGNGGSGTLGGGGGAGGSGGIIILAYKTLTAGTIQVAGGTGGTAGSGGVDAANGSNGTTGVYYKVVLPQ